MIGTRTRLINQMRAFCLEYGIALLQGAGLFKLDLPQVLEDQSNDLSAAMRTFFPERSFKAALSSMASARSRFSFVFSSSSVFSRLASDISIPPNLGFRL